MMASPLQYFNAPDPMSYGRQLGQANGPGAITDMLRGLIQRGQAHADAQDAFAQQKALKESEFANNLEVARIGHPGVAGAGYVTPKLEDARSYVDANGVAWGPEPIFEGGVYVGDKNVPINLKDQSKSQRLQAIAEKLAAQRAASEQAAGNPIMNPTNNAPVTGSFDAGMQKFMDAYRAAHPQQ